MSYPPTPPTYTITEELDYPANIWRWATTDPVKGASGAGATDDVDNYPITQLANRTKYLKAISNGMLTKSVAGSADVALTAAEAANGIIKLTGALTDDINVTVPDGLTRSWVIINEMSGNYDIDPSGTTQLVNYCITLKTASGNGVLIPFNSASIVHSDGVNIYGDSVSIVFMSPYLGFSIKFNNGIVLQCFRQSVQYNTDISDDSNYYTFPLAFPNRGIAMTVSASGNVSGFLGAEIVSSTQYAVCNTFNGNVTCSVIAIGY